MKKSGNNGLAIINKILIVIVILAFCFVGYLLYLRLNPSDNINSQQPKQEENIAQQENPNPQQDNTNPEQVENPAPGQNDTAQNSQEPQPAEQNPDLPPFEVYNFKYIYSIVPKGRVQKIILKTIIPQNEPERQFIKLTSIPQKPNKVYKVGSDTIAEYQFDMPSKNINIIFEGLAKVRTYDLAVARVLNKNFTPVQDLSPYLKPEKFIESNDPYIVNIANSIKGNSRAEILQNMYVYLQKNIHYSMATPTIGAKKALMRKQGKCSEYSAAMTALCRAKKIPARIVKGDLLEDGVTAHAWVEVYFDEYGWVTVDPTHQGVTEEHYQGGKLVGKKTTYHVDDTNVNYITMGRTPLNFAAFAYQCVPGSKCNVSFSNKLDWNKA